MVLNMLMGSKENKLKKLCIGRIGQTSRYLWIVKTLFKAEVANLRPVGVVCWRQLVHVWKKWLAAIFSTQWHHSDRFKFTILEILPHGNGQSRLLQKCFTIFGLYSVFACYNNFMTIKWEYIIKKIRFGHHLKNQKIWPQLATQV